MYLLGEFTPDACTQDYVLRVACLQHVLSVIDILLVKQKCKVSTSVVMTAVIASSCSKEERVELVKKLLDHCDPSDLLCDLEDWALRYTLYYDEWELFRLVYTYVVEHSHNVPETYFGELDTSLCNFLPECRQLTTLVQITQLRKQLLNASL